MSEAGESMNALLASLQERAKELDCLYRVDEILRQVDTPLSEVCEAVIGVIPPGWQYPEVCWARIELEGATIGPTHYEETVGKQQDDIVVQGKKVGSLCVHYSRAMPVEDDGPFLKEEVKLLRTICDRLGNYILQQRLHASVQQLEQKELGEVKQPACMWREGLDTIGWNQRCAVAAYLLEKLLREAIPEAGALYEAWTAESVIAGTEPLPDQSTMSADLITAILDLAANHFNDQKIHDLIEAWLRQNRHGVLTRVVNRNVSVADIADEIRHYHLVDNGNAIASPTRLRGIQAALVRRFLSDESDYLSVAGQYITLADFNTMLHQMVFSADSHGRLGGQGARFFLGEKIIKARRGEAPRLATIDTPKTWYVTSDVLFHFLHTHRLDDTVEQKYKPISQVEAEHNQIVHTFKNAQFPDDIVGSVQAALDDLGDGPLVVRHSSVLDGLPETSFAGRYRSIFVANQGSRRERLNAVLEAIAEVYASMFGPLPISYRSERGSLDLGEEMGLMIQQVVGTRVGKYFLPSFSGTACSRADQVWLPGLKERDGLIYLVPGLNLRQSERKDDDYPVLVAPGLPGKSIFNSFNDRIRYSPKNVHVLDLELKRHATVSLSELAAQGGREMSSADNVLSAAVEGELLRLNDDRVLSTDDNLIVTFEGLMLCTPVISQIKWVMRTFEEVIGGPVEISFASDGTKLFVLDYRLQDRSQ